MKLTCKFALLICLLQQVCNAQVIVNGDFEMANLQPWNFSNPSTYNPAAAPGYTYSISKDSSRPNSSALHISSTGNSHWCQFRQKIAYRAKDSLEKLRLTADVKIKSTTYATANLTARVVQGAKNFGLFQQSLEGNQDWQRVTVDLIVTPQSDSLALFCIMKGEGDVWFDNVSIQKITSEKIAQSAEAATYLKTAIGIIEKNALYKDSVDFNSLVAYASVLEWIGNCSEGSLVSSPALSIPSKCCHHINYRLPSLVFSAENNLRKRTRRYLAGCQRSTK